MLTLGILAAWFSVSVTFAFGIARATQLGRVESPAPVVAPVERIAA